MSGLKNQYIGECQVLLSASIINLLVSHLKNIYNDKLSSCSGVNSTSDSVLPWSETDLALRLPASLSDEGSAADEQVAVEWVAEWVENDHLIFLKGHAIAFVVFLMVCLIDAALLKIVDNLVDPVSADLVTMVRNSDNIPWLIQSNL